MGVSRGEFRQFFTARNPNIVRTSTQGMCPVGSNLDKTPVDVTIISRDERGRWVYGEEVKADRATRQRILPRGIDGSEDRYYQRVEYEFGVEKLKRAGGGRPATLVCAAMPAGYATVFLTPLQTYWAKESMAKLPEAYDTDDGVGLAAKFNPLGFSPENLAARTTNPDLQAIADIANADRDIYLTKNTLYRASFAGALVSDAFHDHNPNAIDTRWIRGQSKTVDAARDEKDQDDDRRNAPEDEHRLGLVLSDLGSIETIAAEIIVGLNDFRRQLEKSLHKGFLIRAGRRIKIDADLENLLDHAIELGVWQALAGVDERLKVYSGDAVETLAQRYAEYHLSVWNKTLIKVSAFLRQPMPIGADGEFLRGADATAATQDQFEAYELLFRLERAGSERERLTLMIEMLKTVDLGLSPEMIAAGIRLKMREIRKLDDAAD
ncbi:hypothetical protein [Rhizobium sp. RU36D]|uniref:hypothetical protein n=1 Tax=Rhizobium sp. RU36D TaxID=1907415 RepID=UPI0009D842A4|nr:hypothetical protein [Rhizobium sp. RU36D]SMC75935.1 hypothetical protein SAMN05880593_10628 [Rhizobium sp. RU36D]